MVVSVFLDEYEEDKIINYLDREGVVYVDREEGVDTFINSLVCARLDEI